MRIAFLSRYQNINRRGVESFVYELGTRLGKLHDVEVFSSKDADDLGKVMRGKFDIVYPLNGRMQGAKVSLGRLFGKYKTVVGGHSGIGRDDVWNIAVCKPDVFVALGKAQSIWAKKWAWGSKVVQIPNGIDLKKFNPAGAKFVVDLMRPIILSVGALEWYKHHEFAIESVRELKRGSLLIVGKGSQKDKLKKLGKEKLGERFMVLDAEYEDMPKIYRACDLFTLPSWDREAFGLVYLEALASGLPVVAPEDATRRQILGEAGVFVDVCDPKKYSLALEVALKVNWKDLPKKQAEKFSWDIIGAKYDKLFRELIHAKN